FAKCDNRIRLFTQENKGRAEALNWGIGLARAPLIARMDADDISYPYRLKAQLDFLKTHPDVGLVGGVWELIDANGRVLCPARPPLLDADIRAFMLQYNAICHSTVIMRRDVALASGGYRTALLDAEDYDLWLRMAERTQMANLDQVVVQYRVHAGQVSIQNMAHQMWCLIAARAAAALRKRGGLDPLSEVKEITPQVLRDLGVTETEIKDTLVEIYKYWIGILGSSYPELAIRVNDDLLQVSSADSLQRSVLADLWLSVAAAHYKKGEILRSLFSVGRGLLIRPIIVGRPVRKAYIRFVTAIRG